MNETLRNVGEYIARFDKQIKQATSEDRQKAYEQGIDFITDWILARNIEENKRAGNIKIIEDRKEKERLDKKEARLSLIQSLDLDKATGRIDFCIHYLGCEVRGINDKGIEISSIPRNPAKVKEAFKSQKGKAIKARGQYCGNQTLVPEVYRKYEETLVVITAPQDILEKVILKHNLSSPALTIKYANGKSGAVWQGVHPKLKNSVHSGMGIGNLVYQIDGLTVSHDLILSPEDKLSMDISKLDDDTKIKGVNNSLVNILEETRNASDSVKRAMMF